MADWGKVLVVASREIERAIGENRHEHVDVGADFFKVAVARGESHKIRT